jgi:5-methylcytosine-specific restriction enzyme subunit McrC
LLLYAQTEKDIAVDQKYILSGNKIYIKTINLNTDFEEIKRQLDIIVEGIYE